VGNSTDFYAAYGSNMDPAQMIARCPRSPSTGIGWIDGWRLTFGGEDLGWDGALATLVPQEGSQVFAVLYELSPWDHEELDRWEAADIGIYHKIHVRVSTLEADVLAVVYVLESYEGGLPSARYLSRLAEAAQAAGAPDEYVNELLGRPCRGAGDELS
jgi:hypothetical protein